jgi:hypothetical protein
VCLRRDARGRRSVYEHELFGHHRYIAQMSVGALAHADVLRSMEPDRPRQRIASGLRSDCAARANIAA